MATQFLQSDLDGAQYVLTSSLSSITASTDKERIVVSLSCENGIDGDIETFYSTPLYAFDGVVELSDVGSLIEEYFRMRNKVCEIITFTFDNVSMDVSVLYCEYAMQDDFVPAKSFFLSSSVQRVHQDSTVAISTVNHGSETPFIIKAVGHSMHDDTLLAVSKSEQRTLQNFVTYFSVADIIDWALNRTDDAVDEELRDVVYFSIEYFGLQKMCFIVPAPAYLTFSFRNIFNVEEFVDVVGIMITKTDVSRDTAVCNGRSRQYDRHVGRSYQILTESLTQEEVDVFEQFLASHRVMLCLGDKKHEVIITDHTCEPSSADDSLASIKFEWRFSEQHPKLFGTLVNGIMPSRRKIFDDTFSPEYE